MRFLVNWLIKKNSLFLTSLYPTDKLYHETLCWISRMLALVGEKFIIRMQTKNQSIAASSITGNLFSVITNTSEWSRTSRDAIAEGPDHTSRGGHFSRPTRLALSRSQQNDKRNKINILITWQPSQPGLAGIPASGRRCVIQAGG